MATNGTNDLDAIFIDHFHAMMQEYKAALCELVTEKLASSMPSIQGALTFDHTGALVNGRQRLAVLRSALGAPTKLSVPKKKSGRPRRVVSVAPPVPLFDADELRKSVAGAPKSSDAIGETKKFYPVKHLKTKKAPFKKNAGAVTEIPTSGRNAVESSVITVLRKSPGSRTGVVVRAVGLPDRTVRDHLKRMVDAKLIVKKVLTAGRQTIPVYSVA